MLNRIKIDSETFNEILESYPKYIEYVDDLSKYFAKGYTNKRIIRVDTQTRTLIIQAYRLRLEQLPSDKDWQQLICVLDDSLDTKNEIRVLPFAKTANAKINKVLSKYYSKKEIERLLSEHSSKKRRKPLHMLVPMAFHDGKIHKFNKCVYYDINGAHTDALCEIFPKASKDLIELHHSGFKDYINIYVGDLCNREHRETFDWIVERTRERLESVIKACGGLILYANTDGVILYKPHTKLKTSSEIGQLKAESIDGVIYTFVCDKDAITTPYTIYQYKHPSKGNQLKGNARLSLRRDMDLSKGIVNKALLIKENNLDVLTNFRTEEIEIYEEN